MGSLFVVYLALTVFGAGITLIDFLGVFDQSDQADDSNDDSDETDANDTAAPAHHGSYLTPGSTGVRFVTGLMGALRLCVYFALGAGPTGLFALFTGLSAEKSLLWSAAIGVGIAALARILRKLVRRELDSSIRPDERLMETAVLLLPITPGAVGKAVLRQYGREMEIYVRCIDTNRALAKGNKVRIISVDDSIYWIEPV
jgi:hypothetical protein